MDFKTAIIWLGRAYRLLEKIKAQDKFQLDAFIDNNYPWLVSKLQMYANFAKVAICATNGKKTTLDLINQILIKDNSLFNFGYTPLETITSLSDPSFNCLISLLPSASSMVEMANL